MPHVITAVTKLYCDAGVRFAQDNSVTLRHRDSTRQQRVGIDTVLEGEADAVLRGFFDQNHL